MTSIAAVCSFVAFGPAVTCLFAKTKQKGLGLSSTSELYGINSLDRGEVSLGAEGRLGDNCKSITRSESEYSLGLNVHEQHIFEEMMNFGLCENGQYVLRTVKALVYVSAIAVVYSVHQSQARYVPIKRLI